MKALVSRVSKAQVIVAKRVTGAIAKGIVVFAALEQNDTASSVLTMAEKIVHLRIFEDAEGKMRHSVKDIGGQILCISNFTLAANTQKGRRPSFDGSMAKEKAKLLFENFLALLGEHAVPVASGVFGEHMDISLDMDGPVNIIVES